MKKVKLLLVVALSLSLAATMLTFTACNGGGSGGSGAVAATVNGTNIMEDDITSAIEAMRVQSGSADSPELWAQALASAGLTPETLRESVIETKARDILISQEAEAKGITADQQAIDQQITDTKEAVGATDDAAWIKTLNQYGYEDEQAFRETLEMTSITNQLYEEFAFEPTDEELTEFIAQNPTAVEGFNPAAPAAPAAPAEGEAAATEGEAAPVEGEEAPADTPAAEEGAAPAEGEATTPPETTPEAPVSVNASDINLSTIPADVLAQFRQLWIDQNKGIAFQQWMTELVENADIVINDMPENLPYNVDMSSISDTDSADPNSFASSSPEAISAAIADGLVITDDVVGTGAEAVAGSTIHVHYIGSLEDGTEFDSNGADDTPFSVVLGAGSVIKGWDAGIVGMKVGGTRTLTIPASLAYGAEGRPPTIPGDATLTFVVELVDVTQG